MDAKKCDRCGKYFSESTISCKGKFNVAGVAFVGEDRWTDVSQAIDLCDDCIEELLKFLKIEKEV